MSKHKLTKKELNAISWRYILGSQLNWNYERMMSSGYLYGILPVLKKFYGHDEAQFQDMMRTHNQFLGLMWRLKSKMVIKRKKQLLR